MMEHRIHRDMKWTDTELQIIMVSDFTSITSRHRRNAPPQGSTKRPNRVRLLASTLFLCFKA
jgi:hypothetical protein